MHHLLLSSVSATALLTAALLGVRNRTRPAVGISVAAFFAGAASLLTALPTPPPVAREHHAALILIAVGLAGSGLFTTVTAVSRRLRAVSPVAAAGSIVILQLLLISGGALEPLSRAGAPGRPELTILAFISVLWPTVGAALLIVVGRRLLRYITSRCLRATLRAAAVLAALALAALAVLAALQLPPGWAAPGTVLAADAVLFIALTLLGLGLIGTRLAGPARPLVRALEHTLLYLRLGWWERRLVAAVPEWGRRTAVAPPSPLHGAQEALYARLVVIWDVTRTLLSTVPIAVLDASVDFAEAHGPRSSPQRRAALAEAGWLSWALQTPDQGQAAGEFRVLDDAAPAAGELSREARFQLQIASVLRREPRLQQQFWARPVCGDEHPQPT
ncbi:hypothetical protein GCM10009613_26850 [Pseudonocardia kongjuensis]|uniref:Uncharacterized protein n=1 Tax=Pseudonocardia kongjuensis TaxID=102227 RepID=A0ABN1XSA1_9PSEU